MTGGMTTGTGIGRRRHDLDWLRVGALGLLILTHVLYFYRTIPWRIQSEHAGVWGDMLVEALAPWRISLVFVIAGAATRFMLDKKDFGSFVQNRLLRLGVPFILALFVLVPPMRYITDSHAAGHGYIEFVGEHALHARNVYGYWVPDLGHVWFLSYLLVYAVVAGLVWKFARGAAARAEHALSRAPLPIIVLGLAFFFILSDAVLKPAFGRTDMLVDDPAGHARCIPAFTLGLLLVRSESFWRELRTARVWLTPAALTLGAVSVGLAGLPALQLAVPAWLAGTASGAFGAITVLGVLALGSTFLTHDSPVMRYLADAIMPIYLLHQPMIIVAGAWLHGSAPLWIEFPLVLASASLIPAAFYHVAIRRFPVIRLLFGLKPESPAGRPVSRPQVTPSAGVASQPVHMSKL